MHHENVAVRTILRTIAAADAAHGVNRDFTALVSKDGVSGGTIAQAHRVLTMAAGAGDQQIAEYIAFRAVKPRLPLMTRCTGLHTLIAANAFIFVDE
jgi:hypothetical protein